MTTAIVTGGSRGIGLAIARAIVKEGGRVMIGGLDAARVERAVAELAAPDRAFGRVCDVRDRGAVDALVDATTHAFGGLNTLINNAGVGAFADVLTMADADWHRVIDTNLTGAFYCSQAALPALRAARGGWIINIASLAGRNYFAGAAAYCASKAGLVAFTEALMLEVRAENIRVSCVMPGSVDTDFSGPADGKTDNSWKLSPDDVAEVVIDLLRHPARSLPSKVEIRPARTNK